MKLIEKIIIAWLGLTTLVVILVVFFPFPIITIENGIQSLEDTYTVGEMIDYEFDYCKHIRLKATISISLEPVENPYNTSYSLGSRTSNLPAQCGHRVSKVLTPSNLTTGEYILTLRVSYFPFKLFSPNHYQTTIQLVE